MPSFDPAGASLNVRRYKRQDQHGKCRGAEHLPHDTRAASRAVLRPAQHDEVGMVLSGHLGDTRSNGSRAKLDASAVREMAGEELVSQDRKIARRPVEHDRQCGVGEHVEHDEFDVGTEQGPQVAQRTVREEAASPSRGTSNRRNGSRSNRFGWHDDDWFVHVLKEMGCHVSAGPPPTGRRTCAEDSDEHRVVH